MDVWTLPVGLQCPCGAAPRVRQYPGYVTAARGAPSTHPCEVKRREWPVLCLAALVGLAACETGDHVAHTKGSPHAFAHLRDPEGHTLGDVELRERAHGVEAVVRVHGLSPGRYVVRIHGRADCEVRRGEAPFRHAGEVLRAADGQAPVIGVTVRGDGEGVAHALVPDVALASGPMHLFDGDGSSLLVVDASGEPRACGVVRP